MAYGYGYGYRPARRRRSPSEPQPTPAARITEAGDARVTEDSNVRRLES